MKKRTDPHPAYKHRLSRTYIDAMGEMHRDPWEEVGISRTAYNLVLIGTLLVLIYGLVYNP